MSDGAPVREQRSMATEAAARREDFGQSVVYLGTSCIADPGIEALAEEKDEEIWRTPRKIEALRLLPSKIPATEGDPKADSERRCPRRIGAMLELTIKQRIGAMLELTSKLPMVDRESVERRVVSTANEIAGEDDDAAAFMHKFETKWNVQEAAAASSTTVPRQQHLDKAVLCGQEFRQLSEKLLRLTCGDDVMAVDAGEFPRPTTRLKQSTVSGQIRQSSLGGENDLMLWLDNCKIVRLLFAARSNSTMAEFHDKYPKGATVTVTGDWYKDKSSSPPRFVAMNPGKVRVEPTPSPWPSQQRGSSSVKDVKIGRAGGRIGLFATEDITEGSTVLVSNALVYVAGSGDLAQHFKDVYVEVVRAALSSPTARRQVSLLWDLLFGSSSAPDVPDIKLLVEADSGSADSGVENLDVEKIWDVLRHKFAVGGIWLLPALIRHSCVPNLCAVQVGPAKTFRSLTRIKTGEELTWCRTLPLQMLPVDRRRTSFSECGCIRCSTETMIKLLCAPYNELSTRCARLSELARSGSSTVLQLSRSMIKVAVDLETLLAGTLLPARCKSVLRMACIVPYTMLLLYKRCAARVGGGGGGCDDDDDDDDDDEGHDAADTRKALDAALGRVDDELVVGTLATWDLSDVETMELLTAGFFTMQDEFLTMTEAEKLADVETDPSDRVKTLTEMVYEGSGGGGPRIPIAHFWLDRCLKRRYAGSKTMSRVDFCAWLRSAEKNKARMA